MPYKTKTKKPKRPRKPVKKKGGKMKHHKC